MFSRPKDFEAFQSLLIQAHERIPIRLLSWCVMSKHWHFVVWPREDGELTAFFRWLAHTHAMRWRISHRTVGYGHLYQGRFKSFPVQRNDHFLTVCRYVERNALTAGVVDRAEQWPWNSLHARERGTPEAQAILHDWPVARPANWVERVNRPITENELSRLQPSIDRGRPLGDDKWVAKTVQQLHLEHTVRREGRPSRPKSGAAKN
jgi:putative transposase